MLKTLSDVVFFGPGLWTLLVVCAIVGVVLAVFRDSIDPLVRKIMIAAIAIVFILWLISLLSGAPVWVH